MNKRTRVVFVQRGKREVFCPLLPFNTHFTLTFYRSFFHFVKYHKFHPNCTNLSPCTFKIRKKRKRRKNKTRNQRHFFVVVFFSFKSLPIHHSSHLYFNAFPFLSFPLYPFPIYSIKIPACYSSSILDSFQLFLVFYRLHSVENFFSETYHILATQLTFWVNLLEF